MNAIEYISEHINPRTVLEHYSFKRIKESSKEFRACCAIHGGDNDTAFVWKKSNNLWFCNTGGCGGGDIFTLIQKIDKVDFLQSVKIASHILGLNIEGMDIVYDERFVERELQKWISLMTKHKKVKLVKYEVPYTGDIYKSTDRFDELVCRQFQAVYAKVFPTEKKMYHEKLVIPIKYKGEVVAVQLRSLDGSLPKWITQPADVQIGLLLYNYDEVEELIMQGQYTDVILVEGIFDVWAYWVAGFKNVVCIFGSGIKDEQYNMLIRLGVDICLSFDNDKAGRHYTEQAIELFKNKVTLTKVTFPEGADPCDCKDNLEELYNNRHYV